MNMPGTVYSCPLNCEKCICQRSSRPGEENSTFIASGWPPLRVPLFITATRGCSACTSTGAFEIGFNSRYLLDIAAQIEGEVAVLRLADPGSPTLVQDRDDKSALYVLMPMRV